jgi:hypothetical protein
MRKTKQQLQKQLEEMWRKRAEFQYQIDILQHKVDNFQELGMTITYQTENGGTLKTPKKVKIRRLNWTESTVENGEKFEWSRSKITHEDGVPVNQFGNKIIKSDYTL